MKIVSLPVLCLSFILLLACSVGAQTGIRQMYVGFQGSGLYGASAFQSSNSITMQSFGDESFVSFTITWDPRTLIFLEAENGSNLPAGSTITLNKTQLNLGRLGISINSPQTFPSGTIEIASLKMIALQEAASGFSPVPVTFASTPTAQITRGINGEILSTIYLNGRTTIFIADPNTFLQMVNAQTTAGQEADVQFYMGEAFSPFTGQTSFRFSIAWDKDLFTFVNASLGANAPPGMVLSLDTSRLNDGRLGLIFNGTTPLPPGSGLVAINIARIRLTASTQAANGYYPIYFTQSPVPYQVFNAQGGPADYSTQIPGYISIGTTTTVTGTLRRPSGQALANTRVILQRGNTRLTATTSSFGTFTFPSVPVGRAQLLKVESKRYKFASTPIFVGSAVNVDLVGLE